MAKGKKHNSNGNGNGRSPRTYPKGFWKNFKKQFYRSPPDMTLAEFCRIHDVPISTAKSHGLKSSDKPDDPMAQAVRAEQEFLDRLRQQERSEFKQYMQALKKAGVMMGDISEKAAADFIFNSAARAKYNSPAEAGRLAVAAADKAAMIAAKIEDVPAESESYGWPLTKEFWPFPYQRDFIFDFPSGLKEYGQDKFIYAFIAGIGSGKTRCGAEKLGEIAWRNRGTTLGVFAPTYKMLADATKKMFLGVLNSKGISYRHNKTENKITLWGDTEILFRSMENPDRIRGPNLSAAWIDEGGQVPDREPFDIILGRVRDPIAAERCIFITTTPKGLNWLYDVVIEEQDQNKVKLYTAATADNKALPDDYASNLLTIYDTKMAKQETEGRFINIYTGMMYDKFARSRNVVERIEYDPNQPLHLTCDFNVAPMCWNIIQQWNDADYIIDEIHIDSTNTQQTIDEFVKRYREQKATIYVYGDVAHGRQRRTSADRTDYTIIQEALEDGKNSEGKSFPEAIMRLPRQNPRIVGRVGAMNARLQNAAGQTRLFFLQGFTKYSIMDMEKCGWIPGTRQPDESDKTIGHHAAAIGYYVYWHYPIFGMRVKKGR